MTPGTKAQAAEALADEDEGFEMSEELAGELREAIAAVERGEVHDGRK